MGSLVNVLAQCDFTMGELFMSNSIGFFLKINYKLIQ